MKVGIFEKSIIKEIGIIPTPAKKTIVPF